MNVLKVRTALPLLNGLGDSDTAINRSRSSTMFARESAACNLMSSESRAIKTIVAAIRRASSRINTVGPVLARFFGVSPVTAVDVKTVYLSRREWWTHHRGGCRG